MNIVLWETNVIKHGLPRQLGTSLIASHLREFGYTVKLISFCSYMTTDELVAITEKHIDDTTVAIGVSGTFWNVREQKYDLNSRSNLIEINEPEWVVDARQILENKHPNLDWLLGGHYSKYENFSFKFNWIEFYGYSEDTILKYMDEKMNRNSFLQFDSNLYIRKQHETDFIEAHEWLPLELGRGCQFKCKFCSEPIMGKKKGTYIRDMECVRQEIMDNYEKFGTTNYYFIDSTVNEDTDKIIELANLVQKLPFKLSWVGFNRMDLIWSKPEQCSILKDSGLVSTYFGIESFHPKASMAIGKGFMGKHGKDFLCELRNKWGNDITYTLSFIIGLPYETPDDIQQTLSWLKETDFRKFSSWTPLYLSPAKTSTIDNSEFSLNYSLYGYKFPNPDFPIYWENKHWTFKEAIDMKATITHPRVFGSYALGDLCSLGFKLEDVQHKLLNSSIMKEIQQKKEEHVRRYVQKSLDYKLDKP
jgi:radical SAM superfamily enzyme YgiQ (UPF0313 family)